MLFDQLEARARVGVDSAQDLALSACADYQERIVEGNSELRRVFPHVVYREGGRYEQRTDHRGGALVKYDYAQKRALDVAATSLAEQMHEFGEKFETVLRTESRKHDHVEEVRGDVTGPGFQKAADYSEAAAEARTDFGGRHGAGEPRPHGLVECRVVVAVQLVKVTSGYLDQDLHNLEVAVFDGVGECGIAEDIGYDCVDVYASVGQLAKSGYVSAVHCDAK